MPSRAYVAHDRAVSAVRMYVQMAVVGFLLASILYGGAMITFLSRYVAGPIPELQFVGGKPRLLEGAGNRRLPIISLKNYVSIQLNSKVPYA